ncbi:ribonuclease H-like protein [Infundibulicybe gibba]|nr:ribonuclease H-like protein [Infundibulicybe gibba]
MSVANTLNHESGPLVWIDCEMTGLNPRKDNIMEIAVLITDGNLELVDEGIEFVIRTEEAALNSMGEWCTKQHGQSGLTQACRTSPHSLEFVSKSVLDYIKRWIPQQRAGILAGNSVHADRSFLVESMPEVIDWLHYRLITNETLRYWYFFKTTPRNSHADGTRNTSALDDIRGSIQELKWYRQNIFIPATPPSK